MSAVLDNTHCLVLNKKWTPLATITLRNAITMLCSTYNDGVPKARVIDPTSFQAMTWDDWGKIQVEMTDQKIASAHAVFKIPEIILLSRYEKLPQPKVHFSRRTLCKRDKFTCQYCAKKCGADEWSVDHVKPRAHGGLTTWENCVLSCVDCNRKKANRTPEQAGMKLLSVPKKPSIHNFRFDTRKPVKSWSAFLGESYMNVELENDNKD